jgi:cytosine/adenosine deaminase-related metal-dependent hydrolase
VATTLIRNHEFAHTVDPLDRVLEDASLVVCDERIAAIGPTAEVEAAFSPTASTRGRRAPPRGDPGFVDTHVHLSETLSRGVFPTT